MKSIALGEESCRILEKQRQKLRDEYQKNKDIWKNM